MHFHYLSLAHTFIITSTYVTLPQKEEKNFRNKKIKKESKLAGSPAHRTML
jgi:hypothetical protein